METLDAIHWDLFFADPLYGYCLVIVPMHGLEDL
jgi:hypothetical protein